MDLQPSPPTRRPQPQAAHRSPRRAEQPGWVLQLDAGLDVHVAGARMRLDAARGAVVDVDADVVVACVRLGVDRVARVGDGDVDVPGAGLDVDRARLAGHDLDVA